MQTITLAQLKEYAIAQPDSRACNMGNGSRYACEGCLMTHYGITHGFDFDQTISNEGWVKWELGRKNLKVKLDVKMNEGVFNLFIDGKANGRTYGELKKSLV